MYHVSAQGVDERMINVHYYYYCRNLMTCVSLRTIAFGWGSNVKSSTSLFQSKENPNLHV